VEIAFLGLASLYAFVIPLKGSLGLVDAGVFLGLFAAYLFRTSRQESEEPDLRGVSADLAQLPAAARRATVVGFFVVAAVYVALVAKPFADALVNSGRALGIDEFLLVQWVAPLASEAPELLVAGILAFRGDDDTALGTLLSSKVNQWTMLVGSLPLAYLAGGGRGSLVLDSRQVEEFLLTAAQALFAVSVLLRLRFRAREAAIIFVTFALQLVLPSTTVRLWLAAGYVVLAVVLFAVEGRQIIPTFRGAFRAVDEDPV
jgi:cation:H+ antiporter